MSEHNHNHIKPVRKDDHDKGGYQRQLELEQGPELGSESESRAELEADSQQEQQLEQLEQEQGRWRNDFDIDMVSYSTTD